jgi:tRNA(Ile)-lysidine synthase
VAPDFGVRLRVERSASPESIGAVAIETACLRNWRPGDRVTLRYSSSPRKVKEVLERLRVTGSSRALWPVLELAGSIVWMQGVEVEPPRGIRVVAAATGDAPGIDFGNGTSGEG